MADQVLYSGVACITDLMVKEGLINLDFADVRAVMREMGKAMMGTGEASGDKRALTAAEAAIANPLIDDSSMKGARGLLISITGGKDLTLFEVDEAATRIREEVDQDANIILGATFDETLDGIIRVSVVATGIEQAQSRATTRHHAGGRRSPAPPPRRRKPPCRSDRAAARDNARLPSAPRSSSRGPSQALLRLAPAPRPCNVERAALAAIAAAVAPDAPTSPMQPASYGDVTVRPSRRSRRCSRTTRSARTEASRAADPGKFIPQAAERPPGRAPRMPKFEDLPMPAQAESGRPAARPRKSTRRRPGCRCCSGWPMSASAAATKRASRRSRPVPPVRRCGAAGTQAAAVRRPADARIKSRYQSMQSARRRRVWTFMAARHLLHRATGRRPS